MAKINRDPSTTSEPTVSPADEKLAFEAPKLSYVKPTVEKHAIVDVTAGFFGTFYGG